jgi:hypothetical protein
MILPFLLASSVLVLAQGPPQPRLAIQPASEAPTPPTGKSPLKEIVRVDLKPEEVGTPEALATSLYAFISGPAGEKRNVEKIRSLFHPQARVMVSAKHPEKGPFLRPIELEAFLSFAVPQWDKGFFEKGTGATVQRFEGLAQVWSPYEIRRTAEGPVEYTGVNALQCAWDGKRWWITHIGFQSVAANPPAAAEPKK